MVIRSRKLFPVQSTSRLPEAENRQNRVKQKMVRMMNVQTEEFITDAEAKEILKQKEKQVELKFEQKNAMDILAKSSDFEAEKIKKLVEELRGIERLREKQVISIANFLPEDREQMRIVLHKEYTNFTPEEIDRILEVVKKNI